MVLAGCFLANTILSYFGIETEVLSYIAGIGIVFNKFYADTIFMNNPIEWDDMI